MHISFNKNKKDLLDILLSLRYYTGDISHIDYLYRKRRKEEMTIDELAAHLEFLRQNDCAVCDENECWRITETGLKRLDKWTGYRR